MGMKTRKRRSISIKKPQTKLLPKQLQAHFGHLSWTYKPKEWDPDFKYGIWEVVKQQGYNWFQVFYYNNKWIMGSSRGNVRIEADHKSLAKCRNLYLSKIFGVSEE
jgi:hypothetical protein